MPHNRKLDNMTEFTFACDKAQDALEKYYWDKEKQYYEHHYPRLEEEKFVYWWHAHAVDALIDGYLRTNNPVYMERISKELKGVWNYNHQTFIHNWYDDMEWFALALLRLWDVTKNENYKKQALEIWEDVKTAWNEHMGGGLAWQKEQLDYKNTPANAPAAILAFRLYQRFGNEDDLQWGKKIFDWNLENLVDKETGFVWDGINRLGDGKIDYEWEFTYCQGVFMQAALEYFQITGNEVYKDMAIKTAREAKRRLSDANGGIIPYEGPDDCGLFRGIFFRYAYELYKAFPELTDIRDMILHHAEIVAEKGQNSFGLIGGNWEVAETETVDMAQHLSGIMVLEMAIAL